MSEREPTTDDGESEEAATDDTKTGGVATDGGKTGGVATDDNETGGVATDGGESDEEPPMAAARYPDGTILYPPHPVGPEGQEPVETVDLSEYRATVVTWTTSTATPPGVREPNHLGIVEFDVDGESVRAIGQLTSDEVEIGDTVEPVYADQLRDPEAGIREPESQSWDGYRFEPVE